ncbi:MAG: protein kinase, partial [Planctomycetota bacterium]
MGAVFSVYEESLRRTLAMKVALPRGKRGDPGEPRPVDPVSLGRFLEEAQITAQLDHPGIVPIYELSVNDGGQVFFTMKLVRGENLAVIFKKAAAGKEGWDQTRVLNVLLRACEALAFAHSRKVIHRDLKPANIMVGRFGETYVMDWGVARVLDGDDRHDLRLRSEEEQEKTRIVSDRRGEAGEEGDSPLVTLDGEVVGTPAYMPPEQAAGQIDRLGPPSDVYGMGAILYELLAGHLPYVEPGVRVSPRSILRWVLDGPPKPLGASHPELAPELIAICEKAMAREMEDRYPSMEELAEDLRAYLEQRVVRAYAAGPVAELKKWVARNRLAAVFTLAGLFVVAGLGFGLAWQQSRSARSLAEERDRVQQANLIITEERDRADAERKRVMRISDGRRLEALTAEMDELWPALPETEATMRAWLERARDLLSRLPQHEQTLAELRSRATAGPHRLDSEMKKFLEHRATDQAVPLGGEFKTEEERAEHIAEIDYWIVEMQQVMDREREFSFGDDLDTAWWHEALYELVMGLRDLAEDDPLGPTARNIEQRLEYAQSTHHASIFDHAEEWDLAIASIADPAQCPWYGGLELEPQLGVVPIGQDPQSGLWEFWHLQTGEKPERTPRGELIYGEESGLVLILIPGGRFLMGAQAEDPEGPQFDADATREEANPDGAPVPMELDPFFLSKHEMTQGQWLRIVGENPSYYGKNLKRPDLRIHTLLYPVESVTWDRATEVLHRRLRMSLPTEAQWEYAC